MKKNRAGSAEPRAIERRIRAIYETIPGSERALADRVLEYPSDVIMCSATELAALAGASKAAVSRFVKRLGYEDFREMQREIRNAQSTGDPIFLSTGKKRKSTPAGHLSAHLRQDMDCLRQTLEHVDDTDAMEVSKKIVKARRIVCLGFRNSQFFAAYARRQIVYIRPHVTLLPAGGQVLMEDMADMGPKDMLFAVGMRRRTPILGEAMELMHDQGVPIAYITDRRAVKTTKYATWSFPCHVRGTSLFDSYVGVVSLINYICTRASEIAGKSGRSRLQRIEDMLEKLGELDSGN